MQILRDGTGHTNRTTTAGEEEEIFIWFATGRLVNESNRGRRKQSENLFNQDKRFGGMKIGPI